MPARTGNTTYIPSKGAITTKPSGKKTFQGKGPAPAGATKEPEATYLTAPTVTVSGGTVKTSGFRSQKAARRARRATRRRQQARSYIREGQAKRKRQGASQEKRIRQTEKAVKASHPEPKPAPKLTPIQKVEQRDAAAFKAEQKQPSASRNGFPVPDRMRNEAKAAKRLKTEYRQAKRAVVDSGGHLVGDLGPEQRRAVRGVARLTHLKPRTLAAQARAEEGDGHQTELEGTHNFFNMGPGISYPSLRAGVKATAENYNTAPYYAGVRATRGKPAVVQAHAIAESPWGTGPLIEQTLNEVGFKGKPNPKAERKLARVQVEAKEKGVKLGVGKAPPKVVTRYKAVKASAAALEKMDVPYVYGGGHNGGVPDPSEGLDCSSSTVYLLDKAGVKTPNIVSGEFGSHFPPGPGAVTIFYNPTHVFLRIGDRYFGTSVGDSGSGGLGYHPTPSPDYLAQYSVAHVPGLGKKQALQLGINPSGPQSFPGMTLSSSGTSATIDSGAGATVSKPGFSKRPIKLTPQQEYRRTARRLREVGVGGKQPAEPEVSPTIKALERRYKVAA